MGFESRHDIFRRFDDLTSYNCEKMMRIVSSSVVTERVRQFSELFPEGERGKSVPLPLTEEYIAQGLSRQNALLLEDSRELDELALSANRAKSTICYYSWHSFLAFLVYTFLRYDEPSRGHGMTVRPMEVDRIGVEFRPRERMGFLSRVLDLFTILGYPIALAEKIPVIRKDHLEFRGNGISAIREDVLSFDEIDKFNIDDFLQKYSQQCERSYSHHIPEIPSSANYSWFNRCILSHVVMFISSNFERYRPHYWSNIKEGNSEFSSRVLVRTRQAHDDYGYFVMLVEDVLKPYSFTFR